jgi:tetratricopeptide (TPR) repeat protein
VYVKIQDYDNAVAAFKRATELDPYDFKAFGALGYGYYLQRQYAMSVESLQHAIQMESGYPEMHYYLGLSQLMLGHKSEAMEQYQELKKLNSDFADKLLSEINKQ